MPATGGHRTGSGGTSGGDAASTGGYREGGGADARSDAGHSCTPDRFAGLVLWLTSDKGVTTNGSHVTSWADQSGLHNDATTPFWAGSPILVKRAVNGHDVVRLSPSNAGEALNIADNASLEWGTGDFIIALVASYRNPGSDALIFSKQDTNPPYTGPALYGNASITSETAFIVQVQYGSAYSARSSTTGLNDGRTRLYCGRRTGGTNLEVRLNSVVVGTQTTDTAVDVSTVGSPVGIGRINNGSTDQQLDGDVAEVVAISGEVSDEDLSCLESYLMKRYAL